MPGGYPGAAPQQQQQYGGGYPPYPYPQQ
jgi:hypothetical protein